MFTKTLPTKVGIYRHRWDFRGEMREHVLFVGYVNAAAPRMQGDKPNDYMPRKLRCCPPDENLHADRLTPAEWGGFWEAVEDQQAAEYQRDQIASAQSEAAFKANQEAYR